VDGSSLEASTGGYRADARTVNVSTRRFDEPPDAREVALRPERPRLVQVALELPPRVDGAEEHRPRVDEDDETGVGGG
jgi:hypothetical protein